MSQRNYVSFIVQFWEAKIFSLQLEKNVKLLVNITLPGSAGIAASQLLLPTTPGASTCPLNVNKKCPIGEDKQKEIIYPNLF